jgi:hydrogen cyanide synthase HcnC
VVVIGGGAIGSCVAFLLARRGASVTLLDASTPGRATSASAGGLWPLGESLGLGCGVIFHATKGGDTNGSNGAHEGRFMEFLCASNERFPWLAQELLAKTGLDVEAEVGTGLLYLLYDEAQQRHARAILDWLGTGRRGVEAWTPEQVRDRDPLVTRDLLGAIHFPG